MKLGEAGKYILEKLKNGLPGQLSYHNAAHTIDVYNAADFIGKQENISDHELTLLLTAAWFHDSGFLVRAKGHELESCRIAKSALPDFGYNNEDIAQICGLIMATRLPQTPKNHLEEILADADLDYLGRDDFFEISELLYQENYFSGLLNNLEEWDQSQIAFIEKHKYFTKTAFNLREPLKKLNLQKIKARLNVDLK